MKTDTYTKFVLTVIAICLSIIVLKDVGIFPGAYANPSEREFEQSSNYGLVPLNEDGSINVRINSGNVIDVRLRGIDEASHLRWEAINVRVSN
jgi:hypothetical protein